MAINPVAFARTVNEQFLRYQLTAFPLTDERLARQAEEGIRGAGARPTPLIKGPYLTLSKAFRMGPFVSEVIAQGALHPAMAGILEHPQLFAHQRETLEAVRAGRHCLVSTGTGSGKTEAFLAPILDHCLRLRDQGARDGVVAVIVYPMNALAIDQLGRLRQMLAGTGISFGMYVGSTAADEGELENVVRMKAGEGKAELAQYLRRHRAHERVVISPAEEQLTERTGRTGYGETGERDLIGIPISDVDLTYTSRITDEEENHFQMPVQVLGYRKPVHRGGEAYQVGSVRLLHLRGQEVRLINVGPADRVKQGDLGYPVCRVCGATRSPYASPSEIQHFAQIHKERCGQEPGWIGFSADAQLDGLVIQELESKPDAVNLGEVLRLGATRILEMAPDDHMGRRLQTSPIKTLSKT